GVIQSLSVSGDAGVMFEDLKTGLSAPLAGMGISFSSSLFGLAGSLALGFLDLQAGQAQNRFYNELEDWLSATVTDVRMGPDGDRLGAASASSQELMAAIERLAQIVEGAGAGSGGKAAT